MSGNIPDARKTLATVIGSSCGEPLFRMARSLIGATSDQRTDGGRDEHDGRDDERRQIHVRHESLLFHAQHHAARADKVSDATTLSATKGIVYTFSDMDAKKGIPPKLRARRVRDHVTRVLIELRRERVRRDAVRCLAVTDISWDCLDLYTIALDAAEDDELRFLVQQARGTIITALVASYDQTV